MSGHPGAGSDTVGRHMVTRVARARPEETAAEVLARLAREQPGSVELVCVEAQDGRLAGALPIEKLFTLPGTTRMRHAMDPSFPRVTPDTDQEHAASAALEDAVDALPVVDRDGRLLGLMPSQALLQVLRQEHVEDLHRLAGIRRGTAQARHAIEDSPLRSARHRLPWLLVGLAGAMVATAAMAGFESTLQANVAIAFFVPGLVYIADAIGTQSETIAVRGLSLTRARIGSLLAGELRAGMLIGATLGLISFPATLVAFGDARLAGAVATAIFLAGTLAATIGLLFPWVLARFRVDPAYGSGPVATVIQDILSLVIYFMVLRAFGI
jgi:magnesium transporter